MINSIISGIGFGMLLAVMVGPVFFGLIQTSIHKGFKYGVFFALGVAVSDITFILLTYFGFSNFFDNATFKKALGIFGGASMCLFGLYYLFKPTEKTVPFASNIQRETKKINIMLKGFVMNILNPSVFFFWIGMVSVVSVRFDANALQIFTFFCATIATVLSLDIFKSYVANRIKVYFTNRLLNMINKGLGIILLVVGTKLLLNAFGISVV